MKCGTLTRFAREGRELSPDELWKHFENCCICQWNADSSLRFTYLNRCKFEGTYTRKIADTIFSDVLGKN